MSVLIKRNLVLFVAQLPAFHFSYALFPGYGFWIITFLIVWFLGWMTWFIIVNQQTEKKWLYITLAFMIALVGQFLSWISFLLLLIHG